MPPRVLAPLRAAPLQRCSQRCAAKCAPSLPRCRAAPAVRRRARAQRQQQQQQLTAGNLAAAPSSLQRPAPPPDADERIDASSSFAALGASLGGWLALAGPAAAYTPAVAPEEATSIAQNAVGVLFTVTFAAFMLRLLRKRASRATNVRLASERRAAPPVPDQPVTAANCFLGAGMALGCALVLWTFTSFLEGAFDAQPVSDQYAVRNVTGTLRSILTGLSYLATFLFAANAVGLTGLGIQVATGGNAVAGEQKQEPPPPPSDSS